MHDPSSKPTMTRSRAIAQSPKMKSYPLLKAGTKTAFSHYHNMSTPTPFGMVFLLPPELRVKAYREIVIAGSVRFLESSKAIHSEAIDIVPQDGVYRLEFDVCKPISMFSVHDSTSPIRNLEIRLNYIETARLNLQLESPCSALFNTWLSRFLGCIKPPFGF